MVEAWLREHVEHAAGRARLRVAWHRRRRAGCARGRSPRRTSRTARASRRARSPAAASARARRAASRIASISACAVGSARNSRSLCPTPDHLAVVNEHRPDRHVVVLERPLRLAQGQAHEVLIEREEALADMRGERMQRRARAVVCQAPLRDRASPLRLAGPSSRPESASRSPADMPNRLRLSTARAASPARRLRAGRRRSPRSRSAAARPRRARTTRSPRGAVCPGRRRRRLRPPRVRRARRRDARPCRHRPDDRAGRRVHDGDPATARQRGGGARAAAPPPGRRLGGPRLHRPRRRRAAPPHPRSPPTTRCCAARGAAPVPFYPDDPGNAGHARRLGNSCSGTSPAPTASTPRRPGRT